VIDGARVLSRPSVTLMTSDHLPPAQKAVSESPLGTFYDTGWGFGMSVRPVGGSGSWVIRVSGP